MRHALKFLATHRELTRRYFLQAGGLALAAGAAWPRRGFAAPRPSDDSSAVAPPEHKVALGDGIKRHDSLLTPQELFFDVSRGDPLPHALPHDKKTEVGLTRETWKLEVISDPEHPVPLRNPLSREKNRALDFAALMQLADKHAVRFVKAMTCLNLGCPLGFGLWEGVPLREVVRLAEPRDNLRRVFYYGYHNDQAEQMFRSSLPIGRIFEDYFDLPPVILCYKLNGQWLTAERGGPVRVVVPEHYGFKSVKWLTHVVLTELSHANDTYAEQGNDIDSPMKTFAATIDVPAEIKAGETIPITGYAQVGVGGLSKVQTWIQPEGERVTGGERDGFASAPWVDMEILGPPQDWGGQLPEAKIPLPTLGFDDTGQPQTWPMKLAVVHWAGVLPGLSPGNYTLRCRAIDERGHAQPFPRPYRRSGHAAIEQRKLVVN